MSNITNVTDVYWVNEAKTRVSAVFHYDNGTSELVSVSQSEQSPFWLYITENVSPEDIEATTNNVIEAGREKRRIESYRKQEREAQVKHNALFNAKIEAFDIREVAIATSARKAKIRKAKSVTEVIAQVVVCIQEAEKAQTTDV